jgi:hypothetical protein
MCMTVEKMLELRRLPDIPQGENTWRVVLNGEEIAKEGIRSLLLVLDKPGRPAIGLELGYIQDVRFNYDGLSHFETGGGGVIVVPFLVWRNELYVALISQYRALVGGPVETVPRGYAEVGKTSAAQADTESSEEMGTVTEKWKSFELPGEPVNTNTSISNTSLPHPEGGRAGARFFAREIDSDSVEDDGTGKPRFKEGAVNPTDPKEHILSWRLAPWQETMKLHDACPTNATGRLMAHLFLMGRMQARFI